MSCNPDNLHPEHDPENAEKLIAEQDARASTVYTRSQLNRLAEELVVLIANERGIEATEQDKKQDTIKKILDVQ